MSRKSSIAESEPGSFGSHWASPNGQHHTTTHHKSNSKAAGDINIFSKYNYLEQAILSALDGQRTDTTCAQICRLLAYFCRQITSGGMFARLTFPPLLMNFIGARPAIDQPALLIFVVCLRD
jgi:hypothetical protein